uniref:Uncharacterized protein n=1 Tax=Ditylenchus dipsaci TaxID=166011 RepID=A0A915D951_9BILA
MQETQFVDHSEDIERRTKVKFDPAVHSVQELKRKKFKFQFEQLLMEGKPAFMVVCKVEECRAILNWNGTSMRYHAKLHGSTANGAGEKFNDSLLKFIACSSQSINVVVDKSFLQLLDAFNDTVISKMELESKLNSFSGRLNKKVIACSAFLDPFEHGQLKSIGELVPGINYNEIEKMVKREARFLCSDVLESPAAKRSAKFPLIQVSQVEKELHGYMSLPICEDEDLLTFGATTKNTFPIWPLLQEIFWPSKLPVRRVKGHSKSLEA